MLIGLPCQDNWYNLPRGWEYSCPLPHDQRGLTSPEEFRCNVLWLIISWRATTDTFKRGHPSFIPEGCIYPLTSYTYRYPVLCPSVQRHQRLTKRLRLLSYTWGRYLHASSWNMVQGNRGLYCTLNRAFRHNKMDGLGCSSDFIRCVPYDVSGAPQCDGRWTLR